MSAQEFLQLSEKQFLWAYVFPLPYIVISEIGISFSIRDLARTKFMLY